MNFEGDPIGYAIHDFNQDPDPEATIIVQSDLCEDDVLPVAHLFRTHNKMPELEKIALANCKGKVLDVGAGAGCHSLHLLNEGFDTLAIESSQGAADFLKSSNIPVVHGDFMKFHDSKYDTILLLMNGIGLAGTLDRLPVVLKHLKNLLKSGGKVIVDSTDIIYMYENEDGSLWMDLNANYYGEMKFNMKYKDVESRWFPWLYLDADKFEEIASTVGFEFELLYQGENNHYLASLKLM